MLSNLRAPPSVFRDLLASVPRTDWDPWLDLVFGLDVPPDDGPDLPLGCVPYLPCPADALVRMVEHAGVTASDIFVDVGAGLGRAAVLTHLLTGASTIGLEIQRHLVDASRDLTRRLNVSRFAAVEGDAVRLTRYMTIGSVFFFYCPFSGCRLEQVVDDLEDIARTRRIRICCVDMPLPPRPWLRLSSRSSVDLAVYRSLPFGDATAQPPRAGVALQGPQ